MEWIIGLFIGCLIGSLIGAVILRAAAKWVQKLDVNFGNAYVTVLLSSIASMVLVAIVGVCVRAATGSMDSVNAVSLLMTPIGFLIQAGIISSRLRIPLGRGVLVSLAMIGVAIGIAMIVGVLVFIIAMLFT